MSSKQTLSLQEVKERLYQWRQSRNPGDRIPEELWSEVVALCDQASVATVAYQLKLDLKSLQKRLPPSLALSLPPDSSKPSCVEFVELPVGLEAPSCRRLTCVRLELEHPDGSRLRLFAPENQGWEVPELMEQFRGRKGCCN